MEVNKSINELRGFHAKEAEETAQAQDEAHLTESDVDELLAYVSGGN